MGNYINKIRKKYKETGKKSLLIYLILRCLVILCMVMQILRGDLNNAFLCVLSLILFTVPTFIQEKFKITLPTLLESIIYIFIFSAEILGEINNFYGIIPHWDTVLHTINGFLAAGIGFSLIDILNQNSKNVNLSPVFVAIVAFCFSMTIGVLWEFIEYTGDIYFKFDMQKDTIVNSISTVYLEPESKNGNEIIIENGFLDIGLHDTMKDLIVNFIGAFVFCIIGFLYIINREKYKFAINFIPIKDKAD